MHDRRIPEWLRHAPTPSVRGFAILAGTEAVARGILISVFPLAAYSALGDARLVSEAYFLIGAASLMVGLLIPYLIRFVPRRWVYISGTLMFMTGALLATQSSAAAVIGGLALTTIAVVTMFVCFNAYVLDHVAKVELGRFETSRLFYSAIGWTAGPALGSFLHAAWRPAPFLIAAAAALSLMIIFLVMRLGNGRLIVRSRRPPANPFGYFPRFFAQPRLITGWAFAVIRSSGWWVYVVFLPIYAVENGLGQQLGGIALSLSNAALFLAPLMLRFMQRRSVRTAVRTGFLMSGLLFALAGLEGDFPVIAVALLMVGSLFLILLDVSAGLPFLLAVKPSERTEMSAIYSSFRDVSGILTPGAAWVILLVAPLSGVFVASGAALLGAWGLARTLHPRLGRARISAEGDRGEPAPAADAA
ncbi:MFS transporter [Ponticoccus sp. SC2-23]|uniref:MFS transporter n=1 Tax=Alexandriicola marinus TaxID=2081710 RepID=UPI000FDCB930|nr:MFS transporter [Alexandriicola marinus]MBM1220009.1 MFS transporter [Ponticoccus sp. SC6-9]MBM1224695.1 MFS transporter [Ponticoccus sp. SC6-15]MBM1228208.1 MFS transporter [Ponticoccus sp. SC6-38]MBM1234154.1 MFS transporter [Ponticoccus sp. SC6-45]MBM1238710.1 MFS transporter [Ponticoccus sp. SC6-49]MBM1242491.1 MFS transporter [Ponticoccus sp. SC2-64]MBM1247678.1 MFS transporter [Ponticoccus sp. SC6-42]MBM1251663.1 MFS transporter [Ponticoccus sp. SC6-33]MBM1256719.1 MFS transporter